MYLRLAKANFTVNLGTMASLSKSWSVSYTTTSNITRTNCPSFVSYNESTLKGTLTATVTLTAGATFDSVTVTSGTAGTPTTSINGQVVTITVPNVASNIALNIVATGGSAVTPPEEPETPVNPPSSLDDIAYEGKTYREIFITNNRAPDINNNSMANAFGNVNYTDSTGTTSIVTDETAAANYVPPYSLKVSGTSSQQAKGSWTSNGTTTAYFLAANVKITDYVKGYCGMIYGTEFSACANRVTDGYEVFASITPEYAASQLFIGSASSANLTGYINNPVAVRTGIFTTVPTVETFTELYKNYTALLIAGNQ